MMTIKNAIRFLQLHDPDATNEEVQDRLGLLNLPDCSLFLIRQVRAGLRSDMRLLEKAGLLRHRKPLIPEAIRNLKSTNKNKDDARE